MNDSLQGQWDSSGGKGSPAPSNRPGTPGGKYRCTVEYGTMKYTVTGNTLITKSIH